jgi:hypothetical protein
MQLLASRDHRAAHNEGYGLQPVPFIDDSSVAAAWQSWWFLNRETARLYGPFECMTADDWRR